MLELSCKTKGNAHPKGKPRVFFTCHPADLERSLDRLCSDLFQAQDCAVYYTSNMNELIGDEDRALQLEQMNLFVVPVSLKLLIEPNRAMDKDVPFALDKHIPILPIMLEPELDVVYSREDKFGALQYLEPDAHDITAISYEKKLKNYLSSVLIDDETAERVRKAFDAYIFLSYRKKDRNYANKLMRLIHADSLCRDIAIWYDEYLTPGESFNDAIQVALDKSELFTLLVTPNLVNEENYIQTTEYPAAKQSGKTILPVEMAETDRKALESHYCDIPQCTTPDDDQFRTRMLDSLRRIALRENDADPTHNYLIGLAYLDGIDVEVNNARGIELITSAAEANLPEAMRRLWNMYREGNGVSLDYHEALKWVQRLVDYYTREYGEEHTDTLTSLSNLANTYTDLGKYIIAQKLHEKVYALRSRILGEEHPNTLASLDDLVFALKKNKSTNSNTDNVWSLTNSLMNLEEKLYALRARILGEEHPDTLTKLADIYEYDGDYLKAVELRGKVYALRVHILGEEHTNTLTSLNRLAITYYHLREYEKAQQLFEKVYALRVRNLGEEHPVALTLLDNLALAYRGLGNYEKGLELTEKVYAMRVRILGEEHPDAITSLYNLITAYSIRGDHRKTLELKEKAYALSVRIYGEENPKTLTDLDALAHSYEKIGDYKKVLELRKKLYSISSRVQGEENDITLCALRDLGKSYGKLGNHKKALELMEKAYALRVRVFGEEDQGMINALHGIALACCDLGDYKKALELQEKVYTLLVRIRGAEDTLTQASLNDLAFIHEKLGNAENAKKLRARLDALHLKKETN